jgi:hypothetical protein
MPLRCPALAALLPLAFAAAAQAAPVSLAGHSMVISETRNQNTTVNAYFGGAPTVLSQTLPGAIVGPGLETGTHVLGWYTCATVDIDPANSRIWLNMQDSCGCSILNHWDIHLAFPALPF